MSATEPETSPGATRRLGAGQVVLEPISPFDAPAEQLRNLYRVSDPALSELRLEDLLEELLALVRELLDVDTVAILLHDADTGQLVARAASGIEEEVEQGVRIPLGGGFAGRIAVERVPIFIADVDHADILNPILREKRIRSLLGVPLVVEGELIGVLHVGSLTEREFGHEDVAVLQLAAARIAPAIERARLFSALEHEHQVAVLLQRSLLPRALPQGVGYSVAARYLAAREEVGGDWYDVIQLPAGQLGLAIGDVVGHGLPAAALMGQLRTALRAHALQGHGPAQTLEHLDRFVQAMHEQPMATAAYAVFDPERGSLRLATAGHLPPIIVGERTARMIEVRPGAPLGGFPYGRYTEQELSVASGEMVVFYTDGLVERRGTPLADKLDELVALLVDCSDPEEACLCAMSGMVPDEGLGDDAAILVLQSAPIPVELRLELPAQPGALSQLRRVLRRWLHDRDLGDRAIAEVTLAVNEACANAIEHAYPPGPATFWIDATIQEGQLVVSVRDSGRWRSPRGQNRGRGLTIMRGAMDDVEVRRTDAGTEIVMRRAVSPR